MLLIEDVGAEMKHLLIDAATASDEAVAVVIALREPRIKIEAITTVMGKVTLENATQNTLLCIAAAQNDKPPVYAGMTKPMFRTHCSNADLVGENGMSDMVFEEEVDQTVENMHAVDAIIRTVRDNKEPVEILALGPLTNIALAITKAPEVMRKVPRITFMGGAAFMGDANPMAEFNVWQDAEAADIVFKFGIPMVMVTRETVDADTALNEADLSGLAALNTKPVDFLLKANKHLIDHQLKKSGERALALSSPIALAVLVNPDIIQEQFDSYTRVETRGSEQVVGTTVNDRRTDVTHPFRANNNESIPAFNCKVVHKVDGKACKAYMLELLAGKRKGK
jgi:purine nucleosidase